MHQIFEGREIDKKYPILATALVEASSKSDEAMVQTEVIMYCLSKAMEDIGQSFRIDQLLIERMLIRMYSSIMNSKNNILTHKLSNYTLTNTKIDK